MRCPACQHQSTPNARFCEQCGVPLAEACPDCGTAFYADARFCSGCGRPRGSSAEPAGEGERRHLTVMFCDLVESTALAARRDPEDMHRLIQRYQETCAAVIDQYDGHIARYLGDGLLVYFGYPQAHEDDAVRAVYAGLGILEGLGNLNARLETEQGIRLSVRIGIHSGPTVVGRIGGDEQGEMQVIGHTMNLAARLQGSASTDSLVVSGETLRLLHGRFVSRDMGLRSFKGIADPVPVYEVLRTSDESDAAKAARGADRIPLIGRGQEMGLLLDRWEQVREGLGQVVLLGGEAGIGKTRLVEALWERLSDLPHNWLKCHCSVYHEHSAFHPVVQLLEQALDSVSDGSTPSIAALEQALEETKLPLPEFVPLLAALLSLPLPERYVRPEVSPEAWRRQTLDALASWLFATAERQPAVVVVEDLHWIDPSSLELLGMLVDQAPTAPVLFLLTFRPSFTPPWGSRSHVSQLTLPPLTHRQTVEMVEGITGGKALPDEVLRQVIAKTDGVPLFVEELTKTVLESGLVELGERRYEVSSRHLDFVIPSTLQDSLMARLDRLGPAKEVAQLAAVLGREFSYDLLEAVSTSSSELLESHLDTLVRAELVYPRGRPPRSAYTFKHTLIQDAAYQSLLKSQRQQFHARVARVLEERFPECVESEPEVLARHSEEGGRTAQAIVYYGRAGERATLRSAYPEAVVHLTRGVELLQTLPENAERDQQELALRIALGPPLIGVKGYGEPEVERTYARARDLCEETGGARQLFEVVWGLANYYQAKSQMDLAKELGHQLVSIAERTNDAQLLSWAHLQIGATYFWCGEYRPSLEHLDQAIRFYNPDEYWFLPGAPDPCVASKVYSGVILWLLGYPDRALATCREGVEMARGRAHPFSMGIALCFQGSLHQFLRDYEAVRQPAEEVITLAAEHDFPTWQGWGGLLLGWVQAHSSDGERGIEGIKQALAMVGSTGTDLGAPIGLLMLAQSQWAVGQHGEALATAEAGLAIGEQTTQRAWDPELLRLKGEILAEQHGADTEAENCFRRAIEASRKSEAKSYELRAAMSLGRLLHRQGKSREGHTLLAEVYGWYTEGLDTADLREASALLAELS